MTVLDTSSSPDTPDTPHTPGLAPPPRRRRLVLWIALGSAVALAALVAVFATATPSSQAPEDSSPLVGQPAPQITGSDQDGTTTSLTSYRGRWVLVDFAASWCDACVQETPQLLDFAAANPGASGATVLTVEQDQSDLGSLQRFLASRHADWPVVDDPAAYITYGGAALPQNFLVDPAGTVVAKFGPIVATQLDGLIAAYPASGLPGSATPGSGTAGS